MKPKLIPDTNMCITHGGRSSPCDAMAGGMFAIDTYAQTTADDMHHGVPNRSTAATAGTKITVLAIAVTPAHTSVLLIRDST